MACSLFCCPNNKPYKDRILSHEPKFKAFLSWAAFPRESSIADSGTDPSPVKLTFAVQVVRQENFGALESTQYFVTSTADGGQDGGGERDFIKVREQWLIDANFEKLNTFKNFKCTAHDKFFEVNVYQKDPRNAHHWRGDVARPAAEIDL